MPTVLALDVSLSMVRPVALPDTTEEYQLRHLAIHGLHTFLDHLAHNYKLEFVSLVAFSYLYEQLVKFTRDFDSIKSALNKVEVFSKTCIETALNGIRSIIAEEWSSSTCQVILVTDGAMGVGQGSLKHSVLAAEGHRVKVGGVESQRPFPLPFPSPCQLHVVCVGDPSSAEVKAALPWYQRLIDLGGHGGELFTLDGPMSFKSVSDMFTGLADKYYSPFNSRLVCGHFDCPVQLFPRPEPYVRQLDDCQETFCVSDKMEVLGFMDIKDIGSPPTTVRHLVLPRSNKVVKEEEEESSHDDSHHDDGQLENGRAPSFTVLLHGSLKVEGMVAVLRVTDNWYGIIYSWADSKKKSNLMLGLFEPGQRSVPWLGDLDDLTSCKEYLPDVLYSDKDKRSAFPVCPPDKRSYAQSTVVWIKPTGLQSDIQKVVRHAKKLPDKLLQFYKELNRTRRAALSFGFLDLLEALAVMLERECCMLPGTAHPNAAFQLEHAYTQLRDPHRALDYTYTIQPLHTNFAQGGIQKL